MIYLRRLVPVLLATLVGAAPAAAQTADTGLRDTLEARSAAFFTSSRTPGLAVGVWKDGRVIYARGFGIAVDSTRQPVTPQTVFHMASITKTFVAIAVMQLVEQGKVRLDDPVVKHVPYFALKDSSYRRITVRQLLSHTAGMPDVTDYGWDKPQYDDGALERWIRGLKDSTLMSRPGEKWNYSNIGFELLADLVAIVSRDSFERYVQQHILTPAGMRHSTLLMTDVDSAHLAVGHEWRGGQQRPQTYPYNRRHAGSSTMHSNVEDMLRYGALQANRGTIDGTRILGGAAYDTMWQPQTDVSRVFAGTVALARLRTKLPLQRVDMGLGWFLFDVNGSQVANHDGEDDGFQSSLMVSADRHVVVVVFANSSVSVSVLSLLLLDAVLR